jgi:Mg2+-importing ATPase
MTDFPEMTIPTDSVDSDMVQKPRRWDVKFIRDFMIYFGLLSSVFDYMTFGVLLFILQATPVQFRTGWFIESVASAALIVLVIRTRQPFFKSKPSKYLMFTTFSIVIASVLLPFTTLGTLFGFVPVSLIFLLFTAIIVGLYVLSAELTKQLFYKRERF